MTKPRAIFIDTFFTFFMNSFDIIPEFLSIRATFVIDLLVNTHLPEIFLDNLLTSQLGSRISTVIASGKTMLSQCFFITFHAFPEYKSWGHFNCWSKRFIDFHEVLDEVESNITRARIPEVVINHVLAIVSLQCEISQK
jgi:hypothetical protein